MKLIFKKIRPFSTFFFQPHDIVPITKILQCTYFFLYKSEQNPSLFRNNYFFFINNTKIFETSIFEIIHRFSFIFEKRNKIGRESVASIPSRDPLISK